MSFDFDPFAAEVAEVLADVGLPVTVSRQGKAVGKGHGIFTSLKQSLDSGSRMAQTVVGTRGLTLSISKPPMVDDTVTAAGVEYVVQTVNAVRPTTTTLVYRLEVV